MLSTVNISETNDSNDTAFDNEKNNAITHQTENYGDININLVNNGVKLFPRNFENMQICQIEKIYILRNIYIYIYLYFVDLYIYKSQEI